MVRHQGLRHDFGEEQIEACLTYLRERGVPGSGSPCHSPMGFLSKAMGQVWSEVQIEQAKQVKIESATKMAQELAKRKTEEEATIERDARLSEEAFATTYPAPHAQNEVVAQYAKRFPMLGRNGPALRGLAVAAWWTEQRTNDKTAQF